MAVYAGFGGGMNDFVFDLDDLLVGRLLSPERLVELTPEQLDVARATVRSEILYSGEIHNHIMEKVTEFLSLADRVIGLRPPGGGTLTMYRVDVVRRGLGEFGRPPRLTPERPTYLVGTGGFDDMLAEKFMPVTRAASLSQAQLRVVLAKIKSEVLFSPAIEKILSDRLNQVISETRPAT